MTSKRFKNNVVMESMKVELGNRYRNDSETSSSDDDEDVTTSARTYVNFTNLDDSQTSDNLPTNVENSHTNVENSITVVENYHPSVANSRSKIDNRHARFRTKSHPGVGNYHSYSETYKVINSSDGYDCTDGVLEESNLEYSNTSKFSGNSLTKDIQQIIQKSSPFADNTKRRRALFVAEEMVASEEKFIDVLRLMSNDFFDAVHRENKLLGRPIIDSVVLHEIFKYLPDLKKINEEILEELKSRLEHWNSHPRLADIFVNRGYSLMNYTNYIRELNSTIDRFEEARRNYPDFDRIVTQFEESPRCSRLTLRNYMVKPVQRLPQYRLLLKDYCNQLAEDSVEFKDTNAAIQIIHEVVDHTNSYLKHDDDLRKLLKIQNNLIGQFEVLVPGRILIKEGVLTKSNRKGKRSRMFFLFNDVLLCTLPETPDNKFKLVLSLPLNRMKVVPPPATREDLREEFRIITVEQSFLVEARSEQERKDWCREIEKAINANAKTSRTHMEVTNERPSKSAVVNEFNVKSFSLGCQAPVWVPDDRASMCMVCATEFSLINRRHHCRCCGKVVCRECQEYRAPLEYMNFRPDRVCKPCCDVLSREVNEFPDDVLLKKFLKTKLLELFKTKSRSEVDGVNGETPLPLRKVCANDEGADICGYLEMMKGTNSWEQFWFVLKGDILHSYRACEDIEASARYELEGYEVYPFKMNICSDEQDLLFKVRHIFKEPSLVFKAKHPASKNRWMRALETATSLKSTDGATTNDNHSGILSTVF